MSSNLDREIIVAEVLSGVFVLMSLIGFIVVFAPNFAQDVLNVAEIICREHSRFELLFAYCLWISILRWISRYWSIQPNEFNNWCERIVQNIRAAMLICFIIYPLMISILWTLEIVVLVTWFICTV